VALSSKKRDAFPLAPVEGVQLQIADRKPTIGVYVHVPFCAASCPYCDYPHAAVPNARAEAAEDFVKALCTEIRRRAPRHDAPVQTIYLGGGTPSQLAARHLGEIFAALRKHFGSASAHEVTVEANPDDLDVAFLQSLCTQGVTRLSLGVQSFFDEDLRALGRRHNAEEAARALPDAREAGFADVSLDLLFGLPGQPLARWQATLERVVQQEPAHVTLYRLTAEAGTPLGRRVAQGETALPGAGPPAAQYERALDVLGGAGLRLYEQTHLARPGFEARHTRRYWRHEPVLGLGPGAHSFFWNADGTATRRANACDWRAYAEALHDGGAPPHERERLARTALAGEYLAQRLRTARGLSLERLARRYGRDLRAERGPTLDRLCAEGYLERAGPSVRPTRAGRLRLASLTDALL
jgi:oxygen-independent coproporphyrinogen-3 oxidase